MNYQNLPSKSNVLRGLISRPGFTFFFFDYSQIEIRIAAWYTRDEQWLSEYGKENADVHEQTGQIVFGRPLENKEERRFAKGFNFAMAYGASVGRVTQLLRALYGGTIDEHKQLASEMLRRFHEKHPGIKNFKYLVADRMMTDAERYEHFIHTLRWGSVPKRKAAYRGYIQNRYGRRYKMPSIIQYKALEWVTSGDAGGDFHTEKFIAVNEYFEKNNFPGGPCALIHDMICCEIADDEKQHDTVIGVKATMEDAPELTDKVPIIVDVEYGKNWLEKKEYEKI